MSTTGNRPLAFSLARADGVRADSFLVYADHVKIVTIVGTHVSLDVVSKAKARETWSKLVGFGFRVVDGLDASVGFRGPANGGDVYVTSKCASGEGFGFACYRPDVIRDRITIASKG